MPLHSLVTHYCLGAVAEHLSYVKIEWAHAVGLLEGEVGIARGLAHHVERSSLALGNAADVFDMLLVDEQAHAFLAFVGDDFLGRECRVADGQLGHVNKAAAFLHQLGEAVHVACRSVVVNADYGVDVFLAQGTYQIVGALLHLRIGSLHGVQLDAAAVATGVHAGDTASTEPDTIVVATHDDNLVALLRLLLQAVAPCAVAHSASQHDYLVVAVLLAVLFVLEGKHRTRDERLSELVAEV